MTGAGESWSERLSALDAGFLDLEEPNAPMHVGSVAIFEGRAPAQGEVVGLIASRLHRVPRYGQKVATVPLDAGRPVWVDDAELDLGAHVHSTALPRPAGIPELERLAAQLLARPLDRTKPPWQLWIVPGVSRGRFAVVSKTHHCMIDGLSGVDLASVLMDAGPSPDGGAPPARAPRPAPGALSLLFDALSDQLRHPLDLARGALSGADGGRNALAELAGGLAPLLRITTLGPAPESSLNQVVGPTRLLRTVSLDLAVVKRVSAALGGTVNDVVLAVVAGALRELLLSRKEEVTGELRVLIPVNVRRAEARGTFGNQVAAVLCPLPVGEPDALARYRFVLAATKRLKAGGQALGTVALTRLGDLTPPAIAAMATRLMPAGRWYNLVVTNVPGPREPLYLLGRRLLACHPVVPLTPVTTLSVALLSYDGSIDVGLLGCGERAKDLPTLARAVPAALAELVGLAKRVATATVAP